METITIQAVARKKDLKNPVKKAKNADVIPAVMYNKHENTPISLSKKEFEKAFRNAKPNTVFKLTVGSEEKTAFIKDYTQSLDKHSALQHVDFYIFNENDSIKIHVPVKVTGVAEGVTMGGILEVFTQSIYIKCIAKNVPEFFTIDISHLQIGHHFNVSDLKTESGIEILDNPSKTIVSVLSPAKEETPVETAAATPAEGEAAADVKSDNKDAKKDTTKDDKKDAKKDDGKG